MTAKDAALTIPAALAAVAREHPHDPALWVGAQKIDFARLDEESRRIATGLEALGIGAGDRVAVWLPNVPEWLTVFFALARLGATTICVNSRFREAELGDLLTRSEAKAVVLCPRHQGHDFLRDLAAVAPQAPRIQFAILVGEDVGAPMPEALTAVPLAALLEHPPMAASAARPETPCIVFTTSGTTNRPKLVVHTQRSVVRHARDVAAAFGFDRADCRTLQVLPYCGTYGFVQAMAPLLAGRPSALAENFEAEEVAALMRRHGVNMVAMTDQMIRRMYAAIDEPKPFPGVSVFVGTRASEIVGLSRERGFRVVGIYGSSEVQALFSRGRNEDGIEQLAAGGGFPVASRAEVRVRDRSTGALLAAGQNGELEIKAPSMFAGYLGDAEATAAAFTPDGFFRTGDLGYLEEDGRFRYLVRLGEVLRLSGFLVNPGEIEGHLITHPAIEACQVVGVEADNKTRAVAFYLGREASEDDLRAFCKSKIASYKVPAIFVHLSDFPSVHSANNKKVNRGKLREMASDVLTAVKNSSPDTVNANGMAGEVGGTR